jgi:phosphoglycolate phosphatase-like HAD superfamily hydrolase
MSPGPRLVLFDIDGTILSARGAGRRALGRALADVYGTAGPIDTYDFHGSTDLQIVRDLLTLAGLAEGEIAAREAALFARYVQCLESEIGDGRDVTLYPGVAAVIRALASDDGCLVGLLTGNIEAGARIKLEPTGLWPAFRLGAYGSDHADRICLPAVAARRAEALVGRPFRGDSMVVIGDTPRDVACGQAAGALVIAVATGRHSVADLVECGADHVFADFTDAGRVVATVLGGRSSQG